jgi:glutathione S-transferase
LKIIEDKRAPNPRRVRIFAAEKGLEPVYEQIDIMRNDHNSAAFLAMNPFAGVPIMKLDDDTVISETVAICRYMEAIQPEPALLGRDARDQAIVEMWNRRMELCFLFPVAQVFRHSHPAMREREVPQVPAWAEANRPRVAAVLKHINDALAAQPFIAGPDFTIADITALVAADFMRLARLERPEDLGHFARWYEEVSARPSAAA